MTEMEEYFPRGGKKPETTKYFKKQANFLGAPEKSEKKKKRQKKETEGDDGYLSDDISKEIKQSYYFCASGISHKTIKEGLLILGRVRQVSETRIQVMLPSKMIGVVVACHISEAYNKLLEAYVNDQVEKVRDLSQMFRPGQYVATKVLEVHDNIVMLSLMPQHINSGKQHADLHKGAILQAAVSSVEDHGFVMDIGVPNTRAFLPKNNVNPELSLDVGMLTWCCVDSVTAAENSIVTLNTSPPALQRAVTRRNPKTPLLPGTALQFTVDKPLDTGIEGHIFDDTTSYIQRNQVDTVKGKKPTLGQKIRAYLLYVMPTRNTPFLTMKDIFAATYPDLQEERKFKDGDIIDEAQVLKITGKSIHFKLDQGSFGTMSLRRVQVEEDMTDEQIIAKSYPIGSTHQVRILCYNLMDFVYSVTDEPSVLNEKYFNIEQLSVGDFVEGTITKVTESNLSVAVGRVNGTVPHAHMTDAGICIDKKAAVSKLPKKKFKEGQTIKARVLAIDTAKSNLILTAKPTLLDPAMEVLQRYEDAAIGKQYTGVVKYIKSNEYILVSFFGAVTAYVPRIYVTKEPIENLATAFHVGQIVNCTILKVDVEAKKMSGSLTTTPFWPEKKLVKSTKKKLKIVSDENSEDKSKKRKLSSNKTENKKSKENSDTATDNVEKLEKKDKSKKTSKKSTEEVIENITKNKIKKNKIPDSNKNNTDSNEEVNDKKKKKKKLKEEAIDEVKTKTTVSEESDAIETDIYDSDSILTPQDQGLIDLSDCITIKDFKKRLGSLKRTLAAKTNRIKKIDKKIEHIEERGLNSSNKKYHTAMYSERLVTEQRIEILKQAYNSLEEKVKELESNTQNNENDTLVQNDTEKNDEPKKTKKREREIKKAEQETSKIKNIKVVESLEPVLEIPSAKDFWSAPAQTTIVNNQEDSSSSDEESKDQPKKKRKKLTIAEKQAKAREEEEKIRELERRAIESESQPRSSEQFERALLANPNCSQLWIAYMAFHLQATEIDKARGVARKALSTISFREEQEKLNVWLALLRLETSFGTKETQERCLEEALQTNEPYKVHTKLLDIYSESSKHQELASLVDLMLRKYSREPGNYIACGSACFKVGLLEKARHVMQRAMKVLEKKEHVPVLVQFALLERSHGCAERAEAVFEQLIATYPRRVDVASAYADMLTRSSDVTRLRQVMERLTSQKLPARKMKVLFKKWMEIEEKIGDPAQVEEIRKRAMDYIEKAQF